MRIEKTQLLFILHSIKFQNQPDSSFWHLDKSGIYSVNSLYKFLNSGEIHYYLTKSVWTLKIPLKVKLFLWLALHNRIFTRDNLSKRGWVVPLICPFCSALESIDHLFFRCSLSAQFWVFLFRIYPHGSLLPTTSLENFWHTYNLPSKEFQFWGSLLAAVLWSIWTFRNHCIFRGPQVVSLSTL
jgi:zinc-binding in reverse transcriptase